MDAKELGIGLMEARNLLTARCDRRLAAHAIAAVDEARNTAVQAKEKNEELHCENQELLRTIAGLSRRLTQIGTVIAVAQDPHKLESAIHHCYENRDCDGCPYEKECRAAFNDPGGAECCPIKNELLDLIGHIRPKTPVGIMPNKAGSNPVIKMFATCPNKKCRQPVDNFFNSACCGRCGQPLVWPALVKVEVIHHDPD